MGGGEIGEWERGREEEREGEDNGVRDGGRTWRGRVERGGRGKKEAEDMN